MFEEICRVYKKPIISHFTTHTNHRLPICISLIPDPLPWKEHAFSSMEPPGDLCIPFVWSDLLDRQLSDDNNCPVSDFSGTVMALSELFLDLLSLLMDKTLQLPLVWNLLVQLYMRKFHQGLNPIRLYAWTLSDNLTGRQISVGKLQRWS